MSANAPWSVKGIDAKAREVAKDLARRSGMTLGEWLNQMILNGEDVGAAIARERGRTAAPAGRPAPRQARRIPEAEIYDDEDDYGYDERFAPRGPRTAAAWREPVIETPRVMRRPAAPYSSQSQPLSSRDLRRQSIFSDRPRHEGGRYDDGYEPEPAPANGELSRVARALETLGSRIESSESRSAGAVRGVSSAVEALLSRLERSEAAHAEALGKLDEQSHEMQSSAERLAQAEEDQSLIATRLEQAERLIDAQAERLEGLSGHLREERERVAKVEAQQNSSAVLDTVRAVEGALGKLANQLYEGDVRTRETVRDIREDMVGLSHRLAQIETRDPDRAAQGLIDKVVAQMAHRLEAAEAQTTGAIRTLEQAFKMLEGRLQRAEERGDVSDPEAVKSLGTLAADLTRRVEDSRRELLNALKDGTHESVEQAMRALDERVTASEKRQAAAIERMGQDVLRVADGLNRRMGDIEGQTREGLARLERDQHDGFARVNSDIRRVAETVAENVESRVQRVESGHAQALERLGGEIARISERLGAKLGETERRTAQVLGGIGEQMEAQRDQAREELSTRIRQSEERTRALLEDARSRIEQKLAQVHTQSLLSETARPAPRAVDDLPNPFEPAEPEPAPSPAPAAQTRVPAPEIEKTPFSRFAGGFNEENEERIDLTGRLLNSVTDFKPEFDPFEDEDDTDLMAAPAPTPTPARTAAPATQADEDDNDPFADIDTARKTAPRPPEPRPQVRSVFDDEEPAPVSSSTRDALAAARAAVRASMEPPAAEDRSILGGLRSGVSRTRGVQPKPVPQKDEDVVGKAAKAAFVAVGATLVIGGGVMGYNAWRDGVNGKASGKAQTDTPIAAAVVTPDVPSAEDQAALQTRFELAEKALKARSPGAVDALKQVANQGYAPAQFRLGGLYSGEDNLVPVNKEEARLWTQRAANGGIAAAMNNLGLMYYNGEGGAQNRSTAAMWFRKAAERGVTNSQYNLGILYQSGDGVPLNPTEAYKWLSIAAKSGDKDAAREARALRGQLSEDQLRQVDTAVAGFTPISDGAPVASSTMAG